MEEDDDDDECLESLNVVLQKAGEDH